MQCVVNLAGRLDGRPVVEDWTELIMIHEFLQFLYEAFVFPADCLPSRVT